MRTILLVTAVLFMTVAATHNSKHDTMHRKDSMNFVKIKKPARVISIYFPTDNGQWTDPMIGAFEYEVFESKFPVEFQRISWSIGQDIDATVESIAKENPDIVYLPDDALYKIFAEKIVKKSGSFIIFSTLYSELHELRLVKNQAGSYIDPPVANLIENLRSLFPLNRVGFVGGPFGEKMFEHIKKRIPKEIEISDVNFVSNFSEYQDMATKISKKCDAVWALAPFGVVDETGKKVPEHRVQALFDGLGKPVIGWGRVNDLKRTMEMTIKPETLGRSAASNLISWFRGDKPNISEISSFGLSTNFKHLSSMGKRVPPEMIGTITTN